MIVLNSFNFLTFIIELVFRKCMIPLGVKEFHVCNLLANSSEKAYVINY